MAQKNDGSEMSEAAGSRCRTAEGEYIGCDIPPDPELLASGWQWRFISDARRALEAAKNYQELGFDVRLLPVNVSELRGVCTACKSMFANFSAIYTRKRLPA